MSRFARFSWAAPGFALLTLLRLPSFIEPHWYADEASYVSVARSLLRGRVLYAQIWNNKPPLQSWTIAGEVALFGSSEAGLHLLTFVASLATLSAIAYAGYRLLGARRACVATVIAAVALGLPVLDAELSVPESLLIAPVTWAGALLLLRLDIRRGSTPARRVAAWPFIVGALVAAGMAYQQTALAEALAFGLAIGLSPSTRRRDLVAFAGTVAAITGSWVLIAIATAGGPTVAFALVGFYLPYTQAVLPSTGAGVLLHAAEILVATALVVVGGVMSRRSATPVWALLLWSGATLLIAGVARQPYAHYLTPAIAPMSLTLAWLPPPRRLVDLTTRVARGTALQVAGIVIAVLLARVAGLDWLPAAAPSPSLNKDRTLAGYYGGAVATAIGAKTSRDWEAGFDARTTADTAVAGWLKKEHLDGSSAVLWSSDAWLYALADLPVLLPTPPIYNDEVLLGLSGPVAERVAALQPKVIVVADDALAMYPEIGRLLDGTRYQRVFSSAPDTVWLRSDAIADLPRVGERQ